ncbi:MAG TPA: tetratricopeptide repeat protein, partial [Lacipirellulaceae bacterium]|nr:tetratricopeptide repeat protein [Lacipirellulaceae bacterium]
MERGDLTRARSLLDQAVAASATDVDARRQLAEALWQEGSREEALVHAERAVELDPRNAPTVARCGEMLMALGAVDQAQRRAEQALELDPTLPAAWALRGRAYRYRGEHERALADLHQALRYDPASEETLLDIAELQYQLG